MKPFLLFGGTSRQRHNYAVEVAQHNGWFFWEVHRNNFQNELRKSSVTANLSGKPNVVYISNVEKLSEKQFLKLLEYVKSSPHRFILSTSGIYKLPKEHRKRCHLIRVGDVPPNKLFESFTKLMTEPNRELVRKILAQNDVNVELMLYILKDNVWKAKNPDVLKSVEACLKCLYKVSKEYIISMLAYLFPTTKLPLSFPQKRKIYKEENDILEKLRKRYKLPKFPALETFQVLKEVIPNQPELGQKLAVELGLTDKERKFLGIERTRDKTPAKLPSNNTSSSTKLEKWF